MAIVINTNIASEQTQYLLEDISRQQMRSMERLTTGMRVNRARDDASGFGVINHMTQQIQGLAIATNNANDGINMMQTGDLALDDSTELLQRMRELGIQSMNATYTSAQRGDMDVEFQVLNRELSRLASNTKFNNQQLFKGADFGIHLGWGTDVANRIMMSGFLLTSVQVDVKTMATASQAIIAISGRMQSIQTQRAKWGAVMTRIENAISGINRLDFATRNSRGRLQDTDYVTETANLARTQVLQQAGMAMLAQANQSPQNVISLLR